MSETFSPYFSQKKLKTMNVKAKELRIGNWILALDGDCKEGVFKVDEIGRGRGALDGSDIGVSYNNSELFLFCSKIEPIPLTIKWLEKFGIKKRPDGHYQLDILYRGRIYFYIGEDKIKIELGNNSGYSFGYPKVEYVHQLQNLYFALTGKELEIKNNSVVN